MPTTALFEDALGQLQIGRLVDVDGRLGEGLRTRRERPPWARLDRRWRDEAVFGIACLGGRRIDRLGNGLRLGALGNNGGATQTMLPATGSPLVDAIPVGACASGITTDQRGLPRPADGDNDGSTGCDIGAVEVQPAPAATAIPAAPAFTG